MKRLVTSLCLVLLLVSGCKTTSPSHERGYAAYKSGDYATTLTEWRPLAEQGDAKAQNNLGVLYDKGHGVPQDYKTAMKWYRLAAKQGHAKAQYNLGLMYDKGHGVPQDDKTAVKWYRLAAEKGVDSAQNFLGMRYALGKGVPKNYKTAVKLLTLAAKQGNATAQNFLGIMYKLGDGVPKNYKTAVKWYRLAAKQGHADAQEILKLAKLKPYIKELEKEERLAKIEKKKARAAAEKAKMQGMVAPYKSRCSAFGFKDGSKEMSKCMFDLYKLEKAKSQTPTIIQNNSGDSSAVRALLEEQKKQRQLEGSLELMKRGFEMMKPPARRPTTRCQFNRITNSMVCR